ncbi:MAG: DUF2220 domain-containing protein [Oscillospiraceae bacterium]|nr:DUF2220 domain-containing protein [Oscillospiraceae bacterium]
MTAGRTQKDILNLLLDKYERSAFFKENATPTRRISINLYVDGKTDFPHYDIEQPDKREEVNRAVLALQEAGVLSSSWMKGEVNHILEKVWLNYEFLSEAYRLLGRSPKADVAHAVCDEIIKAAANVKTSWALGYLTDVIESIKRKRSLPSSIPEDEAERANLIKSIVALEGAYGTEMLERVFSLRTFGDSKTFEKTVKSRLVRILRKYMDNDDDVADDELLGQVGLVKYPEQFEFCGKLSIDAGSATADFSALAAGSAVYSTDIIGAKLKLDSSVKKVLTIENRANYFDYISKSKADDELVIYHGGQFSPRKCAFFHEINEALPPRASWRHWSDIDYGGFLMLLRLRQNVSREILPFRMNESELKFFSMFTARIDLKYRNKLESLKGHEELADCLSCIDYMIANGKRLEQEAMLI